eukprot:7121199-Karenia_brevis.AAC.1
MGMVTKSWPSKEGLDRHTSSESGVAEGMAKVLVPSEEGLDRPSSLKPGVAEGMATKAAWPSKGGLD